MERPKLFHTLVVMGAALTAGSATVTTGCSSSSGSCSDAPLAYNCSGDYGKISTVACDAADPTCTYGRIVAPDSSGDAYARIGVPACDASDPTCPYGRISVDAGPGDAYAHIGIADGAAPSDTGPGPDDAGEAG
jgi:hypothetical protein